MRRSTLVAIALAATLAFIVPASASAVTYTVNEIGDSADASVGAAGCDTVAGGTSQCSLRAAIEESNNSAAEKDTILFSALFNGLGSSTINPASALPKITAKVEIDGDTCVTEAAVLGPCARVNGLAGQSVFTVEADEAAIYNLAVTGGLTGVNVINASTDFVLQGSWIGVKLDGTGAANQKGVFIDPDSDEAQIGGDAAVERNVFAFNTGQALDISGADFTRIEGNYFGVRPDGTTIAPNASNLEVTGQDSSPDFTSIGTRIGADVGATAAETDACDGGCNVFAGTLTGFGNGIDLSADPAEPSEIPIGEGGLIEGAAVQGNYIGLDATGAGILNGDAFGISAAGQGAKGPENVIIGGGEPGEANHINSNTYGVYGEKAPNLRVAGNFFGLNPAGTALSTVNSTSVYVFSDETLLPGTNALVTENTIASGESGIGVEIQGVGANVIENTIGLGSGSEELGAGGIGIYAWGNTGGSLIEGNTIFGASQVGILAKSPLNSITANAIEASAEAGVRVDAPAFVSVFGTEIGGDEAESENVISGTNGPAIELIEAPDGEVSETVIRRNIGSANEDVFIDLGGNGKGTAPGQPNEGIQAPSIDAVTATSASGTSEAFARVRLFRKATPAFGEIQSFLGASTADGSGNWTISFPQQAGQTNIAATQTGISGTSELEFAITPPDPPKEEPEVCAMGANGCGPGGPNQPSRLPDTKIAKKPKLKGAPTAKFKFTSTIASSSFECKLDKKPFKKCRSPKTYKKLKPGKHVFKVRAVSPAGVKDPTPAKKKFKVKG